MLIPFLKKNKNLSLEVKAAQPQNFFCDSLQCGCVLVHRSEVVSPTQWAERAEQKARERIQPLLDEAQVGRLICWAASARFSSFYKPPKDEGDSCCV